MFPNPSGMSLLEQKRLQWAKEREEMTGLCGLWGALEKPKVDKSKILDRPEPRRNSLLPPIQTKVEEHQKEEESETSGYLSDSPQHDYESSTDNQSLTWSAKPDNYWGNRKHQKNWRNERKVQGTPDSLISTPEDRLKWGDRGVGIGHLWEPVIDLPDSRLPQVLEAYRATPRWLERGLKLSDGNNAEILVIQHEDDERPSSNFILGQNAPLPPEVLEERERKRRKALEHQNAIRRQLEERDRKRKEEKENRLREERIEEERLRREREQERVRQEEEQRKNREKELIERRKEEAMKEALEEAERKAKVVKKKQKKGELEEEPEKSDTIKDFVEINPIPCTDAPSENEQKCVKDSSCQAEAVIPELTPSVVDSGSQSEGFQNLQYINDGGVALVLEGAPTSGLLMPQEAVQLLLMSSSLPVQRQERVLTPSKLRCPKLLIDAVTQTERGKCCSISLNSVRSRRSTRRSERTSVRSDSSDKSASLERLNTLCRDSYKHRSRSQPRLNMGERPKWGINRPTVQYLKQSEKDPHYMRRMKRRARRTKEKGTSTTNVEEKLLESEFRLLAFQTDEEVDDPSKVRDNVLENGFIMVSNPSSPRFVRISQQKETHLKTDEPNEEVDVESIEIESESPSETKECQDLSSTPPENIENTKGTESVQVEEIESDISSSFGQLTVNSSENITRHDFEICVTSPDEAPSIELDEKSDPSDLGANLLKIVDSRQAESSETRSIPPALQDDGDFDDDFDDDDDDEDEDNNSVVTRPALAANKSDTLGKLAALRMGLELLKKEVDSRCSTPLSTVGEN